MTLPIIAQARYAAREKYAWPGGYPLYLLMSDGEVICPSCARREWKLIALATRHISNDPQWECAGVEINWEDDELRCAHCNERIPSAYGESE